MQTTTYTEHELQANGIRLHYLDWGGAGPPLLFMHPTGFHAHIWEPYVERFAGRYRCLALDTRGHGDSDKPGSYGWTDFADDLEAFLDRLGLSAITGVGHSAGGTAIAVVAARAQAAFARIALLDPILFFGPPRQVPTSDTTRLSGAARRRMDFPSREAALFNYASKPPFNTWDRRFLELYVRYGVRDNADGTVTLKCSGADEAEMYRWGPRPLRAEEFLPAIGCPVLLVGGTRSDAFSPETAQKALQALPHAGLVAIEGAGHFAPFERPDEALTAVDRFLHAAEPTEPTEPTEPIEPAQGI